MCVAKFKFTLENGTAKIETKYTTKTIVTPFLHQTMDKSSQNGKNTGKSTPSAIILTV